jgi:hypothetical protein
MGGAGAAAGAAAAGGLGAEPRLAKAFPGAAVVVMAGDDDVGGASRAALPANSAHFGSASIFALDCVVWFCEFALVNIPLY